MSQAYAKLFHDELPSEGGAKEEVKRGGRFLGVRKRDVHISFKQEPTKFPMKRDKTGKKQTYGGLKGTRKAVGGTQG